MGGPFVPVLYYLRKNGVVLKYYCPEAWSLDLRYYLAMVGMVIEREVNQSEAVVSE